MVIQLREDSNAGSLDCESGILPLSYDVTVSRTILLDDVTPIKTILLHHIEQDTKLGYIIVSCQIDENNIPCTNLLQLRQEAV